MLFYANIVYNPRRELLCVVLLKINTTHRLTRCPKGKASTAGASLILWLAKYTLGTWFIECSRCQVEFLLTLTINERLLLNQSLQELKIVL